MGWTFYNSNGQRLSSAATNISVLDIDGATDIGAAIVDADLFIIDDGAGGTNRKTAASRIKTYIGTVPSQAVQSDIEGETNQDTYVPPDLIKHSPGVAKVWCNITAAGALGSPDYNVSSVTDTGTGDRTINFTVSFSGTVYSPTSSLSNEGDHMHPAYRNIATGSVRFIVMDSSAAKQDIISFNTIHGDQ